MIIGNKKITNAIMHTNRLPNYIEKNAGELAFGCMSDVPSRPGTLLLCNNIHTSRAAMSS